MNTGADFMNRCTHPGCGARTMRGDLCSRHRPKVPQQRVRTAAHRAADNAQQRARYRKARTGIPSGWEV